MKDNDTSILVNCTDLVGSTGLRQYKPRRKLNDLEFATKGGVL